MNLLNLLYLMSEKNDPILKDVRFWLIIASLMGLVVMTIQIYPG